MDKSLFEIERSFSDLINSAETIESEQEILSLALRDKVDAVVFFRQQQESMIELIEARVKELTDRVSQIESRIQRFDDYVLNCMEINNREAFEGELYKISKRKPSKIVDIYDENLIPIEFVKIPEPKPMIMKKEISEKLKMGEIIEGARLVDGKKSIIVKVK